MTGVKRLALIAGLAALVSGCTPSNGSAGNGSPITIADASVIDSDSFTSTGTSVPMTGPTRSSPCTGP